MTTAQPRYPMVPDGTANPWVQDLDGLWHLRPAEDEWVTGSGGNAHTRCGLFVPSVEVSSFDPREGYVFDLPVQVCASCGNAPAASVGDDVA